MEKPRWLQWCDWHYYQEVAENIREWSNRHLADAAMRISLRPLAWIEGHPEPSTKRVILQHLIRLELIERLEGGAKGE